MPYALNSQPQAGQQAAPTILPIKRLPHAADLPLPAHHTDHAACIDVMAAIGAETMTLTPGQRATVPTGMCFAIPDGHHGQIWPRSGFAAKQGIDTMAGMIDCDYRGELKVVLINHGTENFEITHGMRIAQFLIAPYTRVESHEVDELPKSTRGAGGFGSTGTGGN